MAEVIVPDQKKIKIRINDHEPSDKKFIASMFTPAAIVFIIGIAFPLVMAFYISITNSTIEHFIVFPPDRITGNFLQVLGPTGIWSNTFYQYFYQTVFFVAVSVSLELFLGMSFALIVNKKFFGRGFVRAALLVPWALPTLVSALVFRELFAPIQQYGLVNQFLSNIGIQPVSFYGDSAYNFGSFMLPVPQQTFPFFHFHGYLFTYGMVTLLIIEVWKTTPFIALLILAALQTIPDDLYKAADIEGASAFEKFRHITLPLIKGPVLIAVLFRLIDAIRVYDSVVALRDNSVYSVTVVAVDAWGSGSFGVSAAIAILELLMLIFFAIIIFKMTKNRLLFLLAAFIFLYDRLISLGQELIILSTTDTNFIWIILLLVLLLIVFRRTIDRLFSDLLDKLPQNPVSKIIFTIVGLIVAGLFLSIAYYLYTALISTNFSLMVLLIIIIPIFALIKYKPKISLNYNKYSLIITGLIIIIFSVIGIFNEYSINTKNSLNNIVDNLLGGNIESLFNVNKESFVDSLISNTHSLIGVGIVLVIILSMIVQIFIFFKLNSIKNKILFSMNYKIIFLVDIIVQGLFIILQLISFNGDQEAGIPGLVLAFISVLILIVYWFINLNDLSREDKNVAEIKDVPEHDLKTYSGLLILFEFALIFLFNGDLIAFLVLNIFLIAASLFYVWKNTDLVSQDQNQLANLKLVFGILSLIIIEFFLLFNQNIYTILLSNFLLVIIGIYYFREKSQYINPDSEKFLVKINQKVLLRKRQINRIGFGIIVIVMLSFTLGPFLWMINRAFRNPCRVQGQGNYAQYCPTANVQTHFELSPFLDPNTFSISGFNIVLNSKAANLFQALINGFILSGLTAIVVIVIGSFVAVILSKYHFRGEQYAVLLLFSMSSLPPIIIIIPYLIQINILRSVNIDIFGFTLSNFVLNLGPFSLKIGSSIDSFFASLATIPVVGSLAGLIQTIFDSMNGRLLSLLLPYVAFNLPLGTFLIRSFFENIPDELIKAAKVDGASNFQIFRKILLPLTLPGIFTSGLMVFIQAWNELLFARIFLTGSPESYTVPLALLSFLVTPASLTQIPWNPNLILATGAVVATLPLVILVLILQRYIISGITSGAVKG